MWMKKLQPITQVVGAITIVLLAIYGLVAILGGDLVAWASGAVAPASAASAAEVGQASLSGLANVINYQGMLRQADGSVVNGTYSMTFRLYHATGGTAVHTETLSQVVVRDGLFTVLLGDATKLPTGIFSQPLYISVQMAGDAEMTPRERIAPVPYAVQLTDGIYVDELGRVGIGTTRPQARLDVDGDIRWTGHLTSMKVQGPFTAVRNNEGGATMTNMGSDSNRICFLTRTAFEDIDDYWEIADCDIDRSEGKWILWAKLGGPALGDADASCEAHCLEW